VQASLQEVTERFERLYQGGEGTPGLRELEGLICEKGLVERIAARYPVAVVTGRPRADAQRFLDTHGLTGVPTAMVCMEDAPLKPDPAPVRLAMEKLGVNRAWMVGDSPDDMRAARSAGVVPIGVIAPGDRSDVVSKALESAGASRVLTDLSALEELLP
jgi:HAD superfamily hydrolase (TIGR01548 family)